MTTSTLPPPRLITMHRPLLFAGIVVLATLLVLQLSALTPPRWIVSSPPAPDPVGVATPANERAVLPPSSAKDNRSGTPAKSRPAGQAVPGVPPGTAAQPLPPTGLQFLQSAVHPEQWYYLYVPPTYDGKKTFRLLTPIHGSSRGAEAYTQRFMPFADQNRYVVLAPLFPESVRFQTLGVNTEYRADLRLLELIDEVSTRYAIYTDQFDMFGFSAGAQFAHRFLYAHPERLHAVAIGAPGTVTLPLKKYDWPVGVSDFEDVVGERFNPNEVKLARILLLVGKKDVGSEKLNTDDGAMKAGKTRLARARTLHNAWRDSRIPHGYVELANVAHTPQGPVTNTANRFFREFPIQIPPDYRPLALAGQSADNGAGTQLKQADGKTR